MYNGDLEPDLEAIRVYMSRVAEQRHKGWLRNADLLNTLVYIRDTMRGLTPSACWKVGGIFLMWQIGTPWWARGKILQEELLLAIEPEPNLREATAFLQHYAEHSSCVGVALGTSLSSRDRALGRRYQQLGYAHEASLYYKETPCHS